MQNQSFLMTFFRKIGWDSLAWSLRRLYCPVRKDDFVLEVGSGGNPYFRANVLCDAYLETLERHFVPLIADRPTVLAFVENLPFKDDTFDFVIASHVLEHSPDPEKFLKEIQRVGKAGYIETPNAFMERVCSYTIHRLEVNDENNELVIRKKTNETSDEELQKLASPKASAVLPYLISKYPFNFHVRYFWKKEKGGIKYKILNPEYKFDWEMPKGDKEAATSKSFRLSSLPRKFVIVILRKLLSQNRRNRNLNVLDFTICNDCRKGKLVKQKTGIVCNNCSKAYHLINDRIIDFTH